MANQTSSAEYVEGLCGYSHRGALLYYALSTLLQVLVTVTVCIM